MSRLQASRGASSLEPSSAQGRDAGAAAERPAWRRYALLLGVAAVVVAVDQTTKQVALDRLGDGPVDVIHGVLTMRLTFNSGGAFGLLQGLPGLFLVAAVAVAALILAWARRFNEARLLVPLGMVLGGGLGNVADRLFRSLDGRVVDFVDPHVWPVFNIADACIVTGVLLILVVGPRRSRHGA